LTSPERGRRRRRSLPRLAVLAIVALLGYGALLQAVIAASRDDQRQPADAIVILGAAQYNGKPSPVLRARLDHGAELYRAGLAPRILVLGGRAEGDKESEARVGARYLAEAGVPDTSDIAISEGRSTTASIAGLAAWGRDHGLHTVLLVSDPFHSLRLRIEARQAGLEGLTSPTRTSPISGSWTSEWSYFLGEALKVPLVWLRKPLS
jgi:uncharacterized SAM-binding protein YcdF (DUF218 family)